MRIRSQNARARRVQGAAAAVWLLLPGTACALAELEVTEYSRTSPGATATHGYFHLSDPDLVSHTETLTPVAGGSGDVMAEYNYLYRNHERVNAGRDSGLLVLGPLDPGHSVAKASGYADAGSNTLGGYTNLGASAFVYAGDYSSTAAASTSAKIELTFLINAGGSGASLGDPVAGLRWEFDTHGDLSVHGITYPQTTFSGAAMDFSATILRGPTGMCGTFDCPNGAIAASVQLQTGISGQSITPSSPGDPTGSVRLNNRTWSASHNTGAFKAGGVFKSGGDYNVLLSSNTHENETLADGIGIHTGGSPLDLDYIDFDATVGETLKLTAHLTAAASLAGVGGADADLFGTFSTRVFDPLGRGYDFRFSVAPVPIPPALWLFGSGLAGLIGISKRKKAA